MPYLVIGALLVLGCVTGAVLLTDRLGERENVLALARPVAVGQKLSGADLREVRVARDSGLDVLSAGSRTAVEGRSLAYSLPAGALLTESVLGRTRVPPAGQAVAAVGLKAGQLPAGIGPGSHVSAVAVPGNGEATNAPPVSAGNRSWSAVVDDVRPVRDEQLTVVTLLLAEDDAEQLAAAADGTIRIVVVHGGGGP
ncbi:hypothetical protein GCM10022403_083390 [Streptomyces coacervatus]|uniref:SAF domain-containing protein n=1 Tax=Streptomyces coacervatus TaxID=647381 RepID=A0ABP7JAF5_9ACTN